MLLDPNVVITVTPNQLNKSGDWVTVDWDGIAKPSDTDWIGVYAPPNGEESIDPSKIAPVKYQVIGFKFFHFILSSLSLSLFLSSIVRNLLLICLLVKVLLRSVLSM